MSSATLTNANEGDALQFPWGAIKWLCNDQIDPDAEMTFGIVYLNAGEGNPLHYHPNCEELIYVLSGAMRPPTWRRSYSVEGRIECCESHKMCTTTPSTPAGNPLQ